MTEISKDNAIGITFAANTNTFQDTVTGQLIQYQSSVDQTLNFTN